MAEVNKAKIKDAEDAVRDIINWIKVWNLEEVQDEVKKIDDEVVAELVAKLEKLAKKISGMNVTV